MAFSSIEEILKVAEEKDQSLWEIIYQDDMEDSGMDAKASLEKMTLTYQAMKDVYNNYDEKHTSASGLVGGDGAKMEESVKNGVSISGEFMGKVMANALKMAEANACMRRIVAAPTAGSCGVIPAVFCTYEKHFEVSEEKMVEALYVAAGVGSVIATRAFVSGAAGGCQAEIGAASAMAAAGLTYLRGGSNEACMHSAAMSLANLLGLVCDPVAGLVEVPCVKRNVIGAVNAVSSSDMAIAGISSRIPPDEVIDAMREVGVSLPVQLRETGEGGLAATPTGIKIKKEVFR